MNTKEFIDQKIVEIQKQVGNGKLVCALSGGVDSSVCAVLVNKAVGDQLTCIFVDHGLMRKDEPEEVVETFTETFGMKLIHIDARKRFLEKLAGVSSPEQKRKIIGEEFIRVFEEEAKKLGKVDFLVQGTIYPDIVESGTEKDGKLVKSHHNVGGLPEDMTFELVEPVRELYKNEVREVGIALGMPEKLVYRQPFPGPGLGVRCLGAITEERLEILREADAIFREEIANADLDRKIWQYFVALPNEKSVGVKDGARVDGQTIILRAVHSVDAMTANIAEIPWQVLRKVSKRITDTLPTVTRVVYDITDKPPATIEWE